MIDIEHVLIWRTGLYRVTWHFQMRILTYLEQNSISDFISCCSLEQTADDRETIFTVLTDLFGVYNEEKSARQFFEHNTGFIQGNQASSYQLSKSGGTIWVGVDQYLFPNSSNHVNGQQAEKWKTSCCTPIRINCVKSELSSRWDQSLELPSGILL